MGRMMTHSAKTKEENIMKITNAEAFKKLFKGLYATELWSWPEEKFLEWLNSDYTGPALQEPPTSASILSAIECLLHPQDADDSDMSKAIDTAVRAMRAWAAEHPEPIYPTWEMYLVDRMTADMRDGKTRNPQSVEEYMCTTRIPADIAEKLGIKSKER